jgi:hypothetical protein
MANSMMYNKTVLFSFFLIFLIQQGSTFCSEVQVQKYDSIIFAASYKSLNELIIGNKIGSLDLQKKTLKFLTTNLSFQLTDDDIKQYRQTLDIFQKDSKRVEYNIEAFVNYENVGISCIIPKVPLAEKTQDYTWYYGSAALAAVLLCFASYFYMVRA